MIEAKDTFLVDLTGFLEASQKAFLGSPCLLVDGEDQTFVFGVVRDLLFNSGVSLESTGVSL